MKLSQCLFVAAILFGSTAPCLIALSQAQSQLPEGTGSKNSVPKPEQFVPREKWGSTPDPIPDSRRHTPKYVTLHHAGVLWTNSQEPEQFLRNMQAWGKRRPEIEQPPRNTYWPDLAYHFLIAPDGRIFEGRPLEYEPESNTKYDLAGNINVELMGDFSRQRPSVAQLESSVRITAWLMQELQIEPKNVRTHRDAAPGQTECPGADFYRYFEDGQFRKWVAAVLRGGELKIDAGPPLTGEKPGPTELITETKPVK
jgi:hypothetical protein